MVKCMRDSTTVGNGVDLNTKKEDRKEITVEEEELFWQKGLLGDSSAECLLHTISFFCGKLFGFRANKQTLLRFPNIFLKENFIIFDENISETFHGGLSNLKRIVRWIKYVGHETGVTHSCCLQSLFRLYLDTIQICVCSIEAFYFRPARDGSFSYETMAVGVNTLSKIFPDKLCKKAGIKRKTAHRLRIT